MAADIEAVALVLLGAREAADQAVLLENDALDPMTA